MGGTVFVTPPDELLELLELDELDEELLDDELLLDELLEEEPPPLSGVAPPHAVSNNELKNTPSIECTNPGRLPIDILSPQIFRILVIFMAKKHPFKNQLGILTGGGGLFARDLHSNGITMRLIPVDSKSPPRPRPL